MKTFAPHQHRWALPTSFSSPEDWRSLEVLKCELLTSELSTSALTSFTWARQLLTINSQLRNSEPTSFIYEPFNVSIKMSFVTPKCFKLPACYPWGQRTTSLQAFLSIHSVHLKGSDRNLNGCYPDVFPTLPNQSLVLNTSNASLAHFTKLFMCSRRKATLFIDTSVVRALLHIKRWWRTAPPPPIISLNASEARWDCKEVMKTLNRKSKREATYGDRLARLKGCAPGELQGEIGGTGPQAVSRDGYRDIMNACTGVVIRACERPGFPWPAWLLCLGLEISNVVTYMRSFSTVPHCSSRIKVVHDL